MLFNGTWELVQLPLEKIVIGYKWVFMIKLKANMTLDKYMARLIAKRFLQVARIDLFETFSHVVKQSESFLLYISLRARNRDKLTLTMPFWMRIWMFTWCNLLVLNKVMGWYVSLLKHCIESNKLLKLCFSYSIHFSSLWILFPQNEIHLFLLRIIKNVI